MGRVRRQHDLLDRDDVVRAVGIAELERVLAGDVEIVIRYSALSVAAEDVEGVGARRREGEDGRCGEPHGRLSDLGWG